MEKTAAFLLSYYRFAYIEDYKNIFLCKIVVELNDRSSFKVKYAVANNYENLKTTVWGEM